jgi:hypothetical protein
MQKKVLKTWKLDPKNLLHPSGATKKPTSTRLKPPASAMQLLNPELPAPMLATPAIERRFYRCTPKA